MRKLPKPNKPHHYAGIILVLFAAFLLGVWVFARHQVSSYAATYDSHVYVIIGGEYSTTATVNVTSGQHSFGTCNSAVGAPFAVSIYYTQCDGVQFGPPDGVTIYMPTPPAGFHVSGWKTQQNFTDGSVNCGSTQCMLNFSSGTAYIEVDLMPNTEPTAPTLSISGITASSVNLRWTSGSAGSASFIDYLFYQGSTFVPTSATSFTASGLNCGTTYNYHVSIRTTAGNRDSNTVAATTSACPVAPPAPSPSPSPAPSGGGSGGSSSSGSSSPASQPSTSSGSQPQGTAVIPTNNTTASADATPTAAQQPADPTNFVATASTDTSAISLKWDSASDASYYKLERSTDLNSWTTLADNINGATYNDTFTNFSTLYYYRLTAFNADNKNSNPVMAQAKSSDFTANAGAGKDVTINSDDNVLSVIIPSNALRQPANCSINAYGQLPLYSLGNYKIAHGPYQIICQQLDNTIIKNFAQPLASTLSIPSDTQKQYKAFVVAAFDGDKNSWQPVGKSFGSTSQKQFELPASAYGVVLMGQQKRAPVLLITLVTIGVILVGSYIGLIRFARFKLAKQIKARQDDYWRKMNGF